MTIPLQAVQHIRRMRGGAQAHLMRTSDGFFVTKFRNNPQGIRILANEFFASRLGLWLGLPVSEVQVIEVSDWLIEHTPELYIETADAQTPCASGLHVGARYACDPLEGWATDYLAESQFDKVKAVCSFARVLVLDKWAGNTDGRQAVFSKNARQRKFGITHRSGILLQRRSMGLPRPSAARSVLPQLRVCGCDRLGLVRAHAE